jgi:hypothetical protein
MAPILEFNEGKSNGVGDLNQKKDPGCLGKKNLKNFVRIRLNKRQFMSNF